MLKERTTKASMRRGNQYEKLFRVGILMTKQETENELLYDAEHLAGYTGGDEALKYAFLKEFCKSARQSLSALASINNENDWRAEAHKLKGAARSVGVSSIASWCEMAETPGFDYSGEAREALVSGVDFVVSKLEERLVSHTI